MVIHNTVGMLLEKSCKQHTTNHAVYDSESNQIITYNNLLKNTEDLAKGLCAFGVKKGDHIGILASNSSTWLVTFFAICRIGGIAVLLNTEVSTDELHYAIQFSDITYLFTTESMLKRIEVEKQKSMREIFIMDSGELDVLDVDELRVIGARMPEETLSKIEVKETDVAVIQFTSGTTGYAKAVQTLHRSICQNVMEISTELEYTEKDIILLGAPLFHVLGYIASAITAIFTGATICLMKKFNTVKSLTIIQDMRCTSFHGVPVMYYYLQEMCKQYDMTSLKKGIVAGGLCSDEIIQNCFQKMDLEFLVNYYGQTEALPIGSIKFDKINNKENRWFRASTNMKLKIVSLDELQIVKRKGVGILFVQTPYVMKGYYKNNEATERVMQDGWLNTRDVVEMAENGEFQVKGRMGDVIVRGGENILVSEIERKLETNDLIQKAVVLGIPDKIYGQEIAAFILLEKDKKMSREELCEFLRIQFSKMERPRYLTIVKEIPISATGKVQQYKLLSMLNLKEAKIW